MKPTSKQKTEECPDLDLRFYTCPEDLVYQRVTTKQWRAMLLAYKDRPAIRGRVRQIVAKRIGPGVVELRLKPLS